MASEPFIHDVEAKTARKGFSELKKEAIYWWGHSDSNGTISTCDMGKCQKCYEVPTKENIRKAYDFIAEKDNGEKWIADYVDLGPTDDGSGNHLYLFYGWANC